jgi:hypothetical protein
MNTTITATITPEERIDLQRLRDRILSESHDRIVKRVKFLHGEEVATAWRFTETSMEAIRILPVIDRLLKEAE